MKRNTMTTEQAYWLGFRRDLPCLTTHVHPYGRKRRLAQWETSPTQGGLQHSISNNLLWKKEKLTLQEIRRHQFFADPKFSLPYPPLGHFWDSPTTSSDVSPWTSGSAFNKRSEYGSLLSTNLIVAPVYRSLAITESFLTLKSKMICMIIT